MEVFGDNGENRAKKILMGAFNNKRVANAYLFSGNHAQEMGTIAKQFAKLLNCETVCDECVSCNKIEKSLHPDYIVLEPEGKKGIIKIERIREVKDRVKYGPSEGKATVVVINGADSIESAAANSFLKLLEEPPKKVHFILISKRDSNIPKTVLSRCQKILFTNVEDAEYEDIALPAKKSIPEYLAFSKTITGSGKETDRDEIERRLTGIVKKFHGMRMQKEAKQVLEAIKSIKKMANPRLAVEYMALRLCGAING